jgi:hypothetical protein
LQRAKSAWISPQNEGPVAPPYVHVAGAEEAGGEDALLPEVEALAAADGAADANPLAEGAAEAEGVADRRTLAEADSATLGASGVDVSNHQHPASSAVASPNEATFPRMNPSYPKARRASRTSIAAGRSRSEGSQVLSPR